MFKLVKALLIRMSYDTNDVGFFPFIEDKKS